MSRHGDRREAQGVLATLREHETYEERMNAVLAEVCAAAGRPDAYLYLPDAGGRRLHLELSRARPAEDPTRAPPAPRPDPQPSKTNPIAMPAPAVGPLEEQQEGGAGWSAPTPPLEVMITPEDEHDRVVTTPVGRMYAFVLPAAEGSLGAIVQTGPLDGGSLGRRKRHALEALREPLSLVVAQAREAEALRRALADAQARLEAGQRLAGSALDLDRFTALLLDLALNTTGNEGGFVAIAKRETGRLEVRAAVNMPEGFAERVDLSPETGMFDWSPAAEGGALILRDFDAAASIGARSLLAVPLDERGEPLGIFALVNFSEGKVYDEGSLDLSEAFAEQIRLMIHNARVFGDFSDRYLETVAGLARALDARRPETQGHHEAVSAAAVEIASRMRLEPARIDAIRQAGLIHDVGLAGSAGVEGGYQSDVEHPTLGASLIEHLPLHPDLAAAVATHHEWFDGWGFPRGLREEQIPLAGRVMGLAEFIVEMSSGDAIRPPWTPEQVAAEIEQRRGSQFDPKVADVGIELLRSGDLTVQVPIIERAGGN